MSQSPDRTSAPKVAANEADSALLHRLQRDSFAFFSKECARLRDGLFPDTSAPESPASIAAMGFAMGCYPVAAERGFLSRKAAAAAVLNTLRFLFASIQGHGPEASGYRGFFYHFLDGRTGRRAGESELSSIDTALLVAGALLAGRYFDAADPVESEIRDRADALYDRVEWDWMCDGEPTVRMGWKEDGGFLPTRWRGFNEGLLLYVLALGSPTHPIDPQGFLDSVARYQWRRFYGVDYAHAGPLFVHQMPHCFLDLRGIQDRYMREHDSSYFENSRRAVLVQQRYALANAGRFPGYGPPHFVAPGGEYLGVVVTRGPSEPVSPGALVGVVVSFPYDVSHSALSEGTAFEVMECERHVGDGRVLRLL